MPEQKLSLGLDLDVDDPMFQEESTPISPVSPSVPTVQGGLRVPETKPLSGVKPDITAEADIPFAVHKARKADEARDIYTELHYDLEFGEGMGLGGDVDIPGNAVEESRLPQPGDPEYAFIEPDYSIADPSEDTGDSSSTFRSVANFMFSDEMGLLGMKWDQEGFSWALDNFTNQITEHPYSTAFTLATYLVPVAAAWTKGSRVAGRALKLATEAGDPAAAAGRGITGAAFKEGAGKFQAGGLRFRFDNHARLVKSLAGSKSVSQGRKFWSDDMAQKIMNATPDEVRKLVPERALRKQLIGDWHQNRFLELQALAKSGQLDAMSGVAGTAARAKYSFYKKFSNRYMAALNDVGKEQIENLDSWYSKQHFGALLAALPTQLGEANQKQTFKYMLGETSADDLKRAIGDENFLGVDSLVTKWTDLFKAQAEEGMLSDETIALFAKGQGGVETGFHLPAVTKGTTGFEDLSLWAEGVKPGKFGKLIQRRQFDPAKILSGPTMKHRGKRITKSGVLEDIDNLELNPRKLAVGGYVKDSLIFQVHRGFRDFIASGLRGNQQAAHWLKSADEYAALGKRGKEHYMSIDELNSVAPGLSERVMKMLKIEMAKTGEDHLLKGPLPVIDRELVEQFFGKGPSSATSASTAIGRFAEILTGVHKTARTALNPPTHMANLMGNMMFLSMAGMNPFSKQALNDARTLTKTFWAISKEHRKTGKFVDEIMTEDKLINLLGKDRYITDNAGNKVDVAKLLTDDLMKDLSEAQSFENVEGFQSLMKQLKHLESLEKTGFGDAAVKNVARSIAGIGAAPSVRQTLQLASSAYLGEDMIPKWVYAMHLARQGWGRDAIIREVGRRLPQYRTVGELPRNARRIVLPWITFPAEAARIVKNNMMDNPVSMMAWMQSPEIIQSIATGAGVGVQYDEYEAMVEAAQPWAVRYQSVFLKEGEAPGTLGAVGGAGVGGAIGTALGGAKGAAIGAAGGAAAGAALSKAFSPTAEKVDQDARREYARSWSADFLPHSSLFLSSLHPHEWEKVDPFSDRPTAGVDALQTVKDLSPVEPFAVALPLLELYSGRGSFGREIEAKSGISMANKMALGLLGFISPPMLQKYGMKLEGPGGVYRMSELHEANGGQMTLPRSTTATFGGLAAAGLTFLGARIGLGAPAGRAAGAAVLSGAVGTMAGAEANTRRLMTDLGIMGDPRTGERGDWTLDFFANSFFGLNKSWKISPGQAEFNQSLRAKGFQPMRRVATKQFMDAIKHGSASSAKAELGAVYKSYLYEWGDAEQANLRTIEWMERHIKMLNKLPQFAGMSEEWINNRIAALKSLGPEKSKMHQQQLVTLLSELRVRNLNKAKGTKIVKSQR